MENSRYYTVGDLDPRSWPEFEELFKKYNGVQNSCWCVYYHKETRKGKQSSRVKKEERPLFNYNLKKKLVEEGKSRSVLIFDGKKVVASCQYGTFEELPRIENAPRYASYKLKNVEGKRWRITCFFVDTSHRHKGLAKMALDGALERIARDGGGLVEAYPVTKKNTVEVWFGSVGMFLERRFEIVSDFGRSNVLVRKIVKPISE